MAESKILKVIPVVYDFLLYFECANKDWINKDAYRAKISIKGDGSLMEKVNWNSTPSITKNDSGGATLFGVTHTSWANYVKSHPNKGYSKDLATMGKKGWLDHVEWYWETSCAGKCANYACAFVILTMKWLGFKNASSLLSTLKKNADIKDYPFIKGDIYSKIADATHAFTDPMVAYEFMRKAHSAYLYNISTPGNKNKDFRMGWLNRTALSYTPYGLYMPIQMDGKKAGLQYSSKVSEWESKALQLAEGNVSGFVKIFDWGTTPEQVQNIINNFSLDVDLNSYGSNYSSGATSGAYGGCGGVSQLGSYTYTPPLTIEQINQNRESVLNTLISGSQMPDNIASCDELITVDKQKGVKVK